MGKNNMHLSRAPNAHMESSRVGGDVCGAGAVHVRAAFIHPKGTTEDRTLYLIISRLSYSLFNANYSTRELFLRAHRGNIYRGAHLAYLHRTKKISHKQRHSSRITVIRGVDAVFCMISFLQAQSYENSVHTGII